MSFERLLRRRLGPLEDLVPRRLRAEVPPADARWVRRGVGLELVLRPFEGARVEARGPGREPGEGLDLAAREARILVGLNAWTPASATGLAPAQIAAWIDAGLLYWARENPGVDLPPAHLPSDWAGPVARRRAAWPTPAIETALAVAPMPFMPRGRDLEGASMVGLRFATLERGYEILGATLLGDPRLGAELRRLLPALDGTRDRDALTRLEGRQGVRRRRRLLEVLDLVGALETAPEGRLRPPRSGGVDQAPLLGGAAAPADRGARVTWLGHAAVLLEAEGHALLVDPLFHADSEPPPDPYPRPDPRALPDITAILLTHGDNDHLSPNTLAQLDPRIPVLFPRVRPPPPAHQVDMEGMLRVLGFEDLRPLEPFASLELGPFRVHALPFDGEDWGLEQAQLTYLVEHPELSAFFSADSLGPEATYRWLAERDRPVDLAFMGVSGAAEPMVAPPGLGYGNFYAPWVPPERKGEFVLHTAGPEESARFCDIFRPRFAFGYAAGGTPYIRTEYPDRGSHAAFARALAQRATRPVRLEPGIPVRPDELAGRPPA